MSAYRRNLGSNDVLVCTEFDQIVYPKVVGIILHETELRVFVAGGGLKLFERLQDCLARSGCWVSGSVALKLWRATSIGRWAKVEKQNSRC